MKKKKIYQFLTATTTAAVLLQSSVLSAGLSLQQSVEAAEVTCAANGVTLGNLDVTSLCRSGDVRFANFVNMHSDTQDQYWNYFLSILKNPNHETVCDLDAWKASLGMTSLRPLDPQQFQQVNQRLYHFIYANKETFPEIASDYEQLAQNVPGANERVCHDISVFHIVYEWMMLLSEKEHRECASLIQEAQKNIRYLQKDVETFDSLLKFFPDDDLLTTEEAAEKSKAIQSRNSLQQILLGSGNLTNFLNSPAEEFSRSGKGVLESYRTRIRTIHSDYDAQIRKLENLPIVIKEKEKKAIQEELLRLEGSSETINYQGMTYQTTIKNGIATAKLIHTNREYGKNLVIPDTIQQERRINYGRDRITLNYSVTSIDHSILQEFHEQSLNKGENFKKLTLPASLEKLPTNFQDCPDLEEIHFAENASLKTIPNGCFKGLEKLKKVVLSKGVEIIEEEAFSGCESLEELTIPASVQQIQKLAFFNIATKNSSKLKVTFEGEIDKLKIDVQAFERANIEPIPYAENERVIQGIRYKRMVENGQTVMKVVGTDGLLEDDVEILPYISFGTEDYPVVEIEERAFIHQDKMKNVLLPDSIKKISKSAFKGCSGLEKLDIPKSIECIENEAFASCFVKRKQKFFPSVHFLGDITKIQVTRDAFSENPLLFSPVPLQENLGEVAVFNRVFQQYCSNEDDLATNSKRIYQKLNGSVDDHLLMRALFMESLFIYKLPPNKVVEILCQELHCQTLLFDCLKNDPKLKKFAYLANVQAKSRKELIKDHTANGTLSTPTQRPAGDPKIDGSLVLNGDEEIIHVKDYNTADFQNSHQMDPLFPQTLSARQVIQGNYGNCALCAVTAGLVEQGTDLINEMMKDNGDGTVDIRFRCWDETQQKTIFVVYRVDKTMPNNRTSSFIHPLAKRDVENKTALWFICLEKAYAVHHAIHELGVTVDDLTQTILADQNFYEEVFNRDLGEETVMYSFSQKQTVYQSYAKMIDPKAKPLQPKTKLFTKKSNYTPEAMNVYQEIKQALDNNQVLVTGFEKDPFGGEITPGLFEGHAYTILNATESLDEFGKKVILIHLRNPHGAKIPGYHSLDPFRKKWEMKEVERFSLNNAHQEVIINNDGVFALELNEFLRSVEPYYYASEPFTS